MLKLVIDTDVMVAAFESPSGASRRLVGEVLDGKATFRLSTALMLEYEAVLTRSRNLARSGLSIVDVLEALDDMARLCKPVAFEYRWRPVARDADDDFVIETAINGSADVIATFNTTDMIAGGAAFGIAVERPALVLRRIER